MTPAALFERQDIHRRQEAREWERAAAIAHWLMCAWVKNPPSIDELLGRMKDA